MTDKPVPEPPKVLRTLSNEELRRYAEQDPRYDIRRNDLFRELVDRLTPRAKSNYNVR